VTPVQWQARGQEIQVHTPNHPQAVNVYVGISIYGVTKVHVVAGTSNHKMTFTNKKGSMAKNITPQEYEDLLTNTVLPKGTRFFTNNRQSAWTLEQDNDPIHKGVGGMIEGWNTEYNSSVKLLSNWPPNGHDLSPIKNMWAVVQRAMDAYGCKTFVVFQDTVKREARRHGSKMASALVNNMSKRVKICLEGNGCKTKC